MRNIKNAWKVLSRICVVLAFVFVLESVIQFCYEDWGKISKIVMTQRNRKELNGTLDTIYCGPSVAFNAINPSVMDAKLGTSSFNLAASSQPVMGSYYLMRDTMAENKICRVYQILTIPTLKKGRGQRNYLSPYKQMCTLRWRIAYLAALKDEKRILPILAYSTRVKSYANWSLVKENIEQKTKKREYAQRGYRNGGERVYEGQNAQERNPDYNYWDGALGLEQADAEELLYLRKSAEYCRENGIEYTILLLPQPKANLDGAGDIDNLNECLSDLADELGVNFYNFQLYKNRLTEFADDKFRDEEHMNAAGGEAFSALLAEVVASGHPEEYFYDSTEGFDSHR